MMRTEKVETPEEILNLLELTEHFLAETKREFLKKTFSSDPTATDILAMVALVKALSSCECEEETGCFIGGTCFDCDRLVKGESYYENFGLKEKAK